MNVDEIVKALREECKDCSERHSCDAGHPLLYCPNREAADLITAQQAEIDRLTALNKEAVELIGLAIEQLKKDAHCLECQNHTKNGGSCCGFDVCHITRYHENWQWLHADRYEELKKQMEETP